MARTVSNSVGTGATNNAADVQNVRIALNTIPIALGTAAGIPYTIVCGRPELQSAASLGPNDLSGLQFRTR